MVALYRPRTHDRYFIFSDSRSSIIAYFYIDEVRQILVASLLGFLLIPYFFSNSIYRQYIILFYLFLSS